MKHSVGRAPSPAKRGRAGEGGRYFVVAAALLVAGCPGGPAATPSVAVYSAADRDYAEEIFTAFEKESGIHVDTKWDTEASKTTGLAQAIEAERDRPRCDVFWSSEVLQVARLARAGVLAPLPKDLLDRAGSAPRDAQGRWLGFSARARILIVNTALVASADRPRSYRDLGDPRWKGRVGIADPQFGSTGDHIAALFAKLGEAPARAWLESLKKNEIALCAGNAAVKSKVVSGELAFGFTDTDDASEALAAGSPVAVIFPDQEEGGLGTLVFPNTVSITVGAPHPDQAAKLAAYLASPRAEEPLARGPGKHLPLHGGTARPELFPADLRMMAVDWQAALEAAPAARSAVESVLLK